MFYYRKSFCFARCILCVLAVSVSGACGGEEPGSESTMGPPPPVVVTSGSFDVTASSTFDGCSRATDYNGTYDIEINGSLFSMGTGWTGTWDAEALQGHGESNRVRRRFGACDRTSWTTVIVTFTSQDEFSGSITYRDRYVGECESQSSCQSSWRITGVRQ